MSRVTTRYSPNKENRFREDDDIEEGGTPLLEENSNTTSRRYNFLRDYYFWIFLSIAIIFGILIWFLLQSRLSALSGNGTLLATLTSPAVLTILVIIALIIIAYAGYQSATANGDGLLRLIGNLFFIGFLFLFLLWAFLLVTPGFGMQAFWVSIALVVVALLWMIWLWKTDRMSAYVMIYVVVLFILLSFYTFRTTRV